MNDRRVRVVSAGVPPSARAGFSLLEVLIAMMILSVGAASVLALFAAAANTHRRAVDRTHAALVAERIFAEIQGRYTAGRNAQEVGSELKKELPSQYGNYTWEAFLYQPGSVDTTLARGSGASQSAGPWHPQELYARILVRWKRSGHDRSESFFTILLPRNSRESSEELRREQRSKLLRR